jgi:hypothetical protein
VTCTSRKTTLPDRAIVVAKTQEKGAEEETMPKIIPGEMINSSMSNITTPKSRVKEKRFCPNNTKFSSLVRVKKLLI